MQNNLPLSTNKGHHLQTEVQYFARILYEDKLQQKVKFVASSHKSCLTNQVCRIILTLHDNLWPLHIRSEGTSPNLFSTCKMKDITFPTKPFRLTPPFSSIRKNCPGIIINSDFINLPFRLGTELLQSCWGPTHFHFPN